MFRFQNHQCFSAFPWNFSNGLMIPLSSCIKTVSDEEIKVTQNETSNILYQYSIKKLRRQIFMITQL